MKIAYLSDNFPPEKYGGAAAVAFSMAKAISDLGHEVVFITATQDRNQAGSEVHQGMKIIKLYSDYNLRWRAYVSLYNPWVVKEVRRIFREEGFDVVHAHNIHTHLSYHSLILAKKSGAKTFLTAHDVMTVDYGKAYPRHPLAPVSADVDYEISLFHTLRYNKWRYNPLRNVYIRHALGSVDKIFVVSTALKRVLEKHHISNLEVLHNGLSLRDWTISEQGVEKLRQSYGLEGKRAVLFSGRISNAKGGGKLLQAMRIVAKRDPEAVLPILGKEDAYVNGLLKGEREGSLRDRIIVAGWSEGETLRNHYALSDIVVVPSLCFDSFPNINLEAMASGKPVVGTCFGGTPEAIEDGVTGYIVNPYDVSALASKIIELLEDRARCGRLGEAGRKRLKEHFQLDRQIERTLAWYG